MACKFSICAPLSWVGKGILQDVLEYNLWFEHSEDLCVDERIILK
jgi:hypothetical protein